MRDLQTDKLPDDWEVYDFVKTLTKFSVGRNHQINTSEIQERGKYPVVDQGQNYIAGFSDKTEKVLEPKQPLIIFGDHTRCIKYVDFPFIIGADGTKVLAPNVALFNSKFYYFYLLNLDIPSRGYNRHFKLLKERKILRPSSIEQDNIAHILSQIKSAVETQEKIIQTTTALKKALMHKLFTEGLRREPQSETEIGLMPKRWELVRLEEITTKLKAGGTPKTATPSYWGGSIPLVKVEDVVNANMWLEKTNLYITQEGLNNSSAYLLPKNSIVLSMYGTAGEVAITSFPVAPTQNVLGIIISDKVNCEFLYYALKFSKTRALELIVDRTIFKHFTLAKAKKLLIALPPIDEQKQIAEILRHTDRKISIAMQKRESLQVLFKSMLHNLMTGQIRVKDLKL